MSHVARSTYPDADRRDIIQFVPPRAVKVLDVGCWRGAFGAELKRQRPSVKVVGVEPDETAAFTATRRIDQVIVGRFPQDVSSGPYDCIVFNDVLEHLEDPWKALRAAKELMGEGAKVVAVIPNVRHVRVIVPLVLFGRWEYTDAGILDRTHLRFFTEASMVTLFEDSGYDVESITPLDISDVGMRGIVMRILFSPLGRRHSVGLRATRYGIVAAPKQS
jgi:2-polyprenyl-3-methyl-5-hydroxy-6-metoxy-1,4-benzoquinol methylase